MEEHRRSTISGQTSQPGRTWSLRAQAPAPPTPGPSPWGPRTHVVLESLGSLQCSASLRSGTAQYKSRTCGQQGGRWFPRPTQPLKATRTASHAPPPGMQKPGAPQHVFFLRGSAGERKRQALTASSA